MPVTNSIDVERGEVAEEHERLVERRVDVVRAAPRLVHLGIGAEHVVVGQQVLEAELLDALRVRADRAPIGADLRLREHDTDLHARQITTTCRRRVYSSRRSAPAGRRRPARRAGTLVATSDATTTATAIASERTPRQGEREVAAEHAARPEPPREHEPGRETGDDPFRGDHARLDPEGAPDRPAPEAERAQHRDLPTALVDAVDHQHADAGQIGEERDGRVAPRRSGGTGAAPRACWRPAAGTTARTRRSGCASRRRPRPRRRCSCRPRSRRTAGSGAPSRRRARRPRHATRTRDRLRPTAAWSTRPATVSVRLAPVSGSATSTASPTRTDRPGRPLCRSACRSAPTITLVGSRATGANAELRPPATTGAP